MVVIYELSEEIKLEKNKKHNIEIVIDRLSVKAGYREVALQSRLRVRLRWRMDL